MKYGTIILILLISYSSLNAQGIVDYNKLKNISQITTVKFSGNKGDYWKKIEWLENGMPVKEENFLRDELRSRYIFINDTIHNVTLMQIEKYNANDGELNDTIKYSYRYDDRDRLIEKTYSYNVREIFSNPNDIGLFQRKTETSAYANEYVEEYQYDKLGNVTEERQYETQDGKLQVSINKYRYDNQNNVIEIKRSGEPKFQFPIGMTGGIAKFELEKYKYKYDELGLWTEKTLILNNRKFILAKRTFVKTSPNRR